MILFLTYILCDTNPLWLVASPTPAFAYPHTARDLPQKNFTLPVIGVISTTSRENVDLCLRIILGHIEHSKFQTKL
jgi:hypothetical protein